MITEIRKRPKTVFNLYGTQADFYASEARYPAFVGAWATGKTAMGIMKVVNLSEKYKDNLGIVFRKEYTDLRDSTIKDFEKYTGLKVGSNREVKIKNGSIIMFRHLEELNNIQNVNLGWFLLEQAEEIENDEAFFKLWGRLRRKGARHQGIVIANTNGHNWIYKLWKMNNLEGGDLYEARTADNASNLDNSFLESLEVLKTKKPAVYRRFVLNSWDEADSRDVIIQPQWVQDARVRDLNIQLPVRKIVAVDVARYGDDKTTFYAFEMGQRNETAVLGRQTWDKKNTMETVGLAQIFARRHGGIEAYAVDEIGVGGGVVDRLTELGLHVVPINSSHRDPNLREQYFNRRAEMYQNAADMLESGKVKIEADDEELIEQLSWAKYKTVKSTGVFQVEAKDDIKKRYGRSPDNADAFISGLWALPHVDILQKKDKYLRRAERDLEEDTDPMSN